MVARNNKLEWIEIALRGALVLSALFITCYGIISFGHQYFGYDWEWGKSAIAALSLLFSLRLIKPLYWNKKKKVRVWISSIALTYLVVLATYYYLILLH